MHLRTFLAKNNFVKLPDSVFLINMISLTIFMMIATANFRMSGRVKNILLLHARAIKLKLTLYELRPL